MKYIVKAPNSINTPSPAKLTHIVKLLIAMLILAFGMRAST